jgi:hypothetical protein
MPQLNNPLFNAEDILKELSQPSKKPGTMDEKSHSPLKRLQKRLKTVYFEGNSGISNGDVVNEIDLRFKDFPKLQHVLKEIFRDKDQVEIPKDNDWSPSDTFQNLNRVYGYFRQEPDLSHLFNRLAISGKKMSIIENQAYDDAMAYKLMALFYDPKKNLDENFEIIASKFARLVTKNQDSPIKTPYHDAFVIALDRFPVFREVQDLDSWKTFIENQGFKSLAIFAEYATQQKAFVDIKSANQASLAKKYPRASEHPVLANLCKELLISNEGFEAGLAQVKSGWPKKETDNLPTVDIASDNGQFFWVKLPPQDMRAMYLGNLIPGCCQYINGHSKRCVIDGMTLSDNGFYVMLKAKSESQAKQPRLIRNEVNDRDFAIVAQSYAWKTASDNMCLDSIKWDKVN